MENTSHRRSSEDTTNSMYLSFDGESTMSTACYKTLDAMSDVSALSGIDLVDQNKTGEYMNSTLEIHGSTKNTSLFKTVKKMGNVENLPLRPVSKNILNEYKDLCSTPSKEQLLKTVDVTRGSDATRCVALGLAFLGIDDENPAYFPLPPIHLDEENKENALPEAEEISSLSTCSSMEITTSVIEKKMLTSLSTVASITEDEPREEAKIGKTMYKDNTSVDITDKTTNQYSLIYDPNLKVESENANATEFKTKNLEIRKTKADEMEYMDTIKECLEATDQKVSFDMERSKNHGNKNLPVKPKISILAKNLRRSVCEPNLQTNKPSRILNSDNKRRSLLPMSKKSITSIDAETEIPFLMNRLLKITNNTVETKDILTQKKIVNNQNNSSTDKRRSVMSSVQTRASLMPSAPGCKRPFSFTQRMSVVVKTTLNSPARKIARKSSSAAMSSLQRRSVIPQKVTNTNKLNVKNSELFPTKIMASTSGGINKTSQKNFKTPAQLSEASSNLAVSQRKSKLPSVKGDQSQNKRDIAYTCNICKETYGVKSLLDAHKRSHESDIIPPAFMKKPPALIKKPPTTQSSTITGNSNQCKYCDKKFALLRALHIHLLQNCLKIPSSEKRKLEYTDLNHVEKAQLPAVFSNHSFPSSTARDTPRYSFKQMSKSSTESLNENKDVQKATSILATSVNGNNVKTSHNNVQKNKKTIAHVGVYKTPSKSIPCHLCKLTFKSILDYTNHNLTTHGSNKDDYKDKPLFMKYANID